MTEKRNAIIEALENMTDDNLVCVWNEYCDAVNDFDSRIENMDLLPELFDLSTAENVWNLLNRFYFGSDERYTGTSANPNRDYFYFNGYGNIVSTDYPREHVDIDAVVDWIIENDDPLYCDEIADILDN